MSQLGLYTAPALDTMPGRHNSEIFLKRLPKAKQNIPPDAIFGMSHYQALEYQEFRNTDKLETYLVRNSKYESSESVR